MMAECGRAAGGSGEADSADIVPMRTPARSEATVLLVDDVAANLLALEAVLSPLGCDLVCAMSGEDALRELLRREVAVILIDVMMPGLDGLATAELIKNRASTRHVPIIFLTAGDAEGRNMARGYAVGAVDYLIKPFDPEVLRSKVAVFVELFLMNQELKHQTELARRREREALENRRLYESERGARTQAEAIARAREDAIAMVSHDLQNPMAAVGANIDLLVTRLEQGDSDGASNRVDAIRRGMDRMTSLVQDLLDTARIQSGNLTISANAEDLVSIVHQAAELLGPTLAMKRQPFELKLPSRSPAVRCDRERILQVFSNLLGNASKYSPEQSAITLEANVRAGDAMISVHDHGCGIAADQVPHIFEPYWQALSARSRGLGLGLAIAKGIVAAHGGRIWVDSESGIGSHFHFTIPLALQG
jgi:signal transduction histidine kinase